MNGVIVQPISLSCLPPQQTSSVSKKNKQRSIRPSDKLLPICNVGKRVDPPAVKPADSCYALSDAYSVAKSKNYMWLMTQSMNSSDKVVSSWTRFSILTRSHLKVEDDVVGYLPTTNAPAHITGNCYENYVLTPTGKHCYGYLTRHRLQKQHK